MMICIGNIGGIVGSFIYKDSEAPKYPTGFGTALGFAAAGLVCELVLEVSYWTSNLKSAMYSAEEWRMVYTEDELENLGDRSPLFKYSL
jgi:hypothetical protein